MKIINPILISLLLLCLGCSGNVEEKIKYGEIFGVVYDKNVGDPIPVAQVQLSPGGKSTVTGSDGSFSFKSIEAGKYSVSVTKKGYNDGNNNVDVVSGEKVECNLLMERIPAYVTSDKTELDFGDNATLTTLSFNIVNSSYENLSWHIDYDKSSSSFIAEVSPESGTTQYGKTAVIVVKIDRDKLNAGANESTIVVVSDNGDGSSEVKVKAVGIERNVPQLNTLAVSDISSTSAMLNGEIISVGSPAYTERGFVYSLNSMPTFDNMLARLTSPINSDAVFSYELKGLSLGEEYYVRAYAVNRIGTAYSSNEIKFTTVATPPELTMQEVSNINVSNKSATLSSSVDKVGDPIYFERGFVYGTNNNPTIKDNKEKVNGTGDGTFSTNISGLRLNKRYYVRSYALRKIKDSEQEYYSKNEVSFTIITTAAQVTVQDVSNLSVNAATATLNGTVINVGAPEYIERGFVYGTTNNPTIEDTRIKVNGGGEGPFSTKLTGLQLNQQYYVRAYALCKSDDYEQIVYSPSEVSFNLTSTEPLVSINDITNLDVSTGSATFNGAVINAGIPAYSERGFVYGSNRNPTVDDTKVCSTGTGTGPFSAIISGLKLNQQYYVRSYATYMIGTIEYQVYSPEEVSFILTPTKPVVTVENLTNLDVSTGSATFNGAVINAGIPAYSERGFVYGFNRNPTVDDNRVLSNGTGTGAFSITVHNLELNKTYYVRSYIINTAGIVYSQDDASFTLNSVLPELDVKAVSNISVENNSVTLNGIIKSAGVPQYGERGFVYGTLSYPTLNDNFISVPGTGIGAFSATLHNLQLGQTYYVRSYASTKIGNEIQTVYSRDQASFRYEAKLPTVSIYPVNTISYVSGSVSFSGEVSYVGDPTYEEKGFVYSSNTNPLISDNKVKVDGNNSGSFSVAVSGLATNMDYYVRSYAINKAGVAYSNSIQFKVNPKEPYVGGMSSTVDKEHKTATLKATVSGLADPPVQELGFVYSNISSNPTLSDYRVKIEGQTEGEISTTIPVDIDKTYTWMVYLITDAGTKYSRSESFKTSTTYPSVATLAASNENTKNGTVTLNGKINGLGVPTYTEKGFVYSSSTTLPTISDTKVTVSGTSTGQYSIALTGLKTNTFYYARAYAINVKGIVYGDVIQLLGPDYYTYSTLKLQIQKNAGPEATLTSATNACNSSTLGGYSDWRLPTLDELSKLYDQKNEFDNYSYWIWTSTYAKEDYLHFYDGPSVKVKYNYIFNNGSSSEGCISSNYPDTFRYRCVRKL